MGAAREVRAKLSTLPIAMHHVPAPVGAPAPGVWAVTSIRLHDDIHPPDVWGGGAAAAAVADVSVGPGLCCALSSVDALRLPMRDAWDAIGVCWARPGEAGSRHASLAGPATSIARRKHGSSSRRSRCSGPMEATGETAAPQLF